jgi:hypothetical protein
MSPFAVAPAFVRPVAVLVMLTAALLTWLVGALRRWRAFLNVAIAGLALYVVRFMFKGVARRLDAWDDWWAKPWAVWAALAAVTAVGAAWYFRRPGLEPKPGAVEKLVPSLLGLGCLVAAGLSLCGGWPVPDPLWVARAATWSGAVCSRACPACPRGCRPG